jgi:small subunit ribosomal protein S6
MSRNKVDTTPHYEMLYIVSGKFTEEEAPKAVERVGELIKKQGAKETYSEVWKKKKFCYPINHENYGYYFLVEFDCDAESVQSIDKEMRMSTDIVRHMIVAKQKLSQEEIAAQKQKEQARVDEEIEAKKQEIKEAEKEEEKPKTKKVKDLTDLDDKLDKILDTDDLL